MRAQQVIECTCMWRNDVPEGLGLCFPFRPGDTRGLVFARQLFEQVARMDRVEAAPAEMLEVLAQLTPKIKARAAEEMTLDDAIAPGSLAFRAFCIVEWLERHEHIPSDEENGIGWLLLGENRELVLVSRSPPTAKGLALLPVRPQIIAPTNFDETVRTLFHLDAS